MKEEKNLINIFLDKLNKKEYIKFGENKEIKENNIGTFLLDFINTSNSDDLETIRTDFISVIDYVYNIYNLEEIKDLKPFERYYTLTKSRLESDITKYSYDLNINLDIDINWEQMKTAGAKEKYVIEQIKKSNLIACPYFVSSTEISNILYISLKEIITMQDLPIKKCQNCGKYFIPVNRTDEVYCNNIYKDNKTCKEIGFWQFKKRRYQEDDVARLYRNTYQQKLLRVKRNPNNEEYNKDLEKFRNEYQVIKKAMADGKKDKEDFKKWLLSVKRNIR